MFWGKKYYGQTIILFSPKHSVLYILQPFTLLLSPNSSIQSSGLQARERGTLLYSEKKKEKKCNLVAMRDVCDIHLYIQPCTPFCRKKVKHRADVNRAVRVLSYRPSLEGNRYQNDIPGAERAVSPPGSDGYSTALEGRPVDLTTVDYIDAAEGRPASVSVAGYVSASEARPRTNVIVVDNDQYEGPESTG